MGNQDPPVIAETKKPAAIGPNSSRPQSVL